ncbi:hypothetical protein MHYP_G00116300 [Metynnis hypsauchen]
MECFVDEFLGDRENCTILSTEGYFKGERERERERERARAHPHSLREQTHLISGKKGTSTGVRVPRSSSKPPVEQTHFTGARERKLVPRAEKDRKLAPERGARLEDVIRVSNGDAFLTEKQNENYPPWNRLYSHLSPDVVLGHRRTM